MNTRPRMNIANDILQGLGVAQPARISIKDGRFALVDQAGNKMACNLVDQAIGFYLDVIIVDANSQRSKIFFANDYEPSADEPPACFSDNGEAPSANAMTPQSPTCAICQWNVIGSAVSKLTGAGIKACQDRKKLAVLVVGAPGKDIYQLQITPGSLTNMRAYAGFIGKHPSPRNDGSAADMSDLVTRLSFEPGKTGILQFSAAQGLDAAQVALVDQAWASGATISVVGKDDQPVRLGIAGPQQHPGQLAAPQVLQSPAPQPTYQPPPQQFAAPAQQNGAFAPQQPAPNQQQQAPAPRGRGGARQGAGRRPAQTQAPASAPPAQPAGAAFGAPPAQPAPQPQAPQGATLQGGPAPFAIQAAQPVQPPAAGTMPDVPAFLQRPATAPAAAPQAPAPSQGGAPQQQFGMSPAATPSAELNAALDRAFSAPIPGR